MIEGILAGRDIHPLYQPIVDLHTGKIVAVEALARGPEESPLHYPDALFAAATESGLLFEVDTLCAARALGTARAYGGTLPPLLFVNADPGAFTRRPSPDLAAALADPGPYRSVLEITERALATNPAGLLEVAQMVHALGNCLALDDVGADPLSLAFLPLIEPEVVKLDMHLLRDPYSDDTVTTAAGVGAFAERTGAVVIAEGIESEHDRDLALQLGAGWGQGWLFGRPGPLEALAGRELDRHARLPSRSAGLHLPDGTPFTTVAARHHPRRMSAAMASAFVRHLLAAAAGAGKYGVLLAGDQDPAGYDEWLPGFEQVAPLVGFAGLIQPAGSRDPAEPVRRASTPALRRHGSEAALVLVSPDSFAALSVRRSYSGDDVDLVLTRDPATVLELARMLLGRFGARLGSAETARVPTGAVPA